MGIIPARAGFTLRDPAAGGAAQDHPRSRGVYRIPQRRLRAWEGSSPLARGLPPTESWVDGWSRIIPARAGFTGPRTLRMSWPADHPRSRGVYTDGTWTAQIHQGSSPLARGLRVHRRAPGGCTGIIPARAGFTLGACQLVARAGDHPRSRGVYGLAAASQASGVGSSPLARGLRSVCAPPAGPARIIPARAGFTCGLRPCGRQRADHPRSRGVYVLSGPLPFTRPGSSPLARGLRLRSRPLRRARRDHPRSRGVYASRPPSPPYPYGSSPLARGLRLRSLRSLRRRGIIPARAGFT